MKKHTIFLLILTSFLPGLWAQQAGLNAEGEKIIRFEDGSWRYLDEEDPGDLKLWKAFQEQQQSIRQKEEKEEKAPLEEKERLNAAREWLKEAKAKEEQAIVARLLVEEKLNTENDLSEGERNTLEIEFQKRKESEEQAAEGREKAEEAVDLAEKLLDNPGKERWIEKFNALFPEDRLSPAAPQVKEPKSVFYHNASIELKKYDKQEDVYFNPPPYPCHTLASSPEEKERDKLALEPALLFTYTNEKLRPFLKKQDFISCKASLRREEKKLYVLQLEIVISSHLARDEFGYIDKDSPLLFNLIDGGKIILYNHKTDTGELNEEKKTVTYRPEYVLENFDKKVLEEIEISSLRLVWSAGYEDYPIYEMDFFIDRFPCLE